MQASWNLFRCVHAFIHASVRKFLVKITFLSTSLWCELVMCSCSPKSYWAWVLNAQCTHVAGNYLGSGVLRVKAQISPLTGKAFLHPHLLLDGEFCTASLFLVLHVHFPACVAGGDPGTSLSSGADRPEFPAQHGHPLGATIFYVQKAFRGELE